MIMFIHFFCLCPLSLTIKLNFNISKVAYMSLRANFYLRGMRDRSMRSGTELARVQEIENTGCFLEIRSFRTFCHAFNLWLLYLGCLGFKLNRNLNAGFLNH